MKNQNLINYLQELSTRLSSNRYIKAISSGMMGVITVTIIGSICSILMNLPIDAWKDFINGNGIRSVLSNGYEYTYNILSLYVAFLVAKNLVQELCEKTDASHAGIISILSFLILTPMSTAVVNDMETNVLTFNWLGSSGLFTALITALVVGTIYSYIVKKGIVIKMPDTVPTFVSNSFTALIPGVVISLFMLIVAMLFHMTDYGSIHEFIYSIIQIPLQHIGSNIWSLILASLLCQMMWFFGINGTGVLIPLVLPIWLSIDMQNAAAYAAGAPLQNMTGMQFFSIFTTGGMAIGLVIMMLFAKSKQYRILGKISIIPAIFNITEPVIFGTPLVYNFKFFIPFVLSSPLSLGLAYLITQIGLVPMCSGIQSPMGTPLVVNAFLQGGWRIALLQVVLLALCSLLWYPGFRKADQEAFQLEQASEE